MEPAKTPKPRQREEEADHEHEHVHMNGHKKSSLLEMGSMENSLRSKDKQSLQSCQAIGREV